MSVHAYKYVLHRQWQEAPVSKKETDDLASVWILIEFSYSGHL